MYGEKSGMKEKNLSKLLIMFAERAEREYIESDTLMSGRSEEEGEWLTAEVMRKNAAISSGVSQSHEAQSLSLVG